MANVYYQVIQVTDFGPYVTKLVLGMPREVTAEELKPELFSVYVTIRKKDGDLKGNMASQGTTPRQLTDLIGSLCDLTSGSGDKGTPVVLVQGYFDNYTN